MNVKYKISLLVVCTSTFFHISLSGAAPAVHSKSYARNGQKREIKQEGKAEAQPDKQSLESLLKCFERLPKYLQKYIAGFLVGSPDEFAGPDTWRARTRRLQINTHDRMQQPIQVTVGSDGDGRFATQHEGESFILLSTTTNHEPFNLQYKQNITAQDVQLNGNELLIVEKGSQKDELIDPFTEYVDISCIKEVYSKAFSIWRIPDYTHHQQWEFVGGKPTLILAQLDSVGMLKSFIAARAKYSPSENRSTIESVQLPYCANSKRVSLPNIGDVGILQREATYELVRETGAIALGAVANQQKVHAVYLVGENAGEQAIVVIATHGNDIEVQQQMMPEEIKGAVIELKPRPCAQLTAQYQTLFSGLTAQGYAYVHAYNSGKDSTSLFQCAYKPRHAWPARHTLDQNAKFIHLIQTNDEYSAPGVRLAATGSSPCGDYTAWCTAHPNSNPRSGFWNLHITTPYVTSFYNAHDLAPEVDAAGQPIPTTKQKRSDCLRRLTFLWGLCQLYEFERPTHRSLLHVSEAGTSILKSLPIQVRRALQSTMPYLKVYSEKPANFQKPKAKMPKRKLTTIPEEEEIPQEPILVTPQELIPEELAAEERTLVALREPAVPENGIPVPFEQEEQPTPARTARTAKARDLRGAQKRLF